MSFYAGEGFVSYFNGSLPADSRSGTSIASFSGWERQHTDSTSLHRWELYCFTRSCRSFPWPAYAGTSLMDLFLLWRKRQMYSVLGLQRVFI